MFQFRRFPTQCYFIHKELTEYCSAGFPHSEIHGSLPAFVFPWLFVYRYVLHRLPMPRHSPYALLSLTIFELCLILLIFMLIAGFYPTLTFVIVVHFSSFALRLLFIIQFSSFVPCKISLAGGHKWTRTTDLTLIRRAL